MYAVSSDPAAVGVVAYGLFSGLSWIYVVGRQARLERKLRALEASSVMLPVGRTGPAGPPGPPGRCKCEDAVVAAQDARTPQEKRRATMTLHRLIREGKMPPPPGWKPPRKRKKKARRKKRAS